MINVDINFSSNKRFYVLSELIWTNKDKKNFCSKLSQEEEQV